MGNQVSASQQRILATPLSELQQPVAVVNAAFCADQPVTLQFTADFHSWRVHEALTGKKRFQVDGSVFSLIRSKKLLDADNKQLVCLRHEPFSKTVSVVHDLDDGRQPLFQFDVKASIWESFLNGQFRDLAHDRHVTMGIAQGADWRHHAALFWIDLGDGVQRPIARVYRPSQDSARLAAADYHVDIAAKMDQALIVMLCVALDESDKQSRKCK